jgi:hypothetical protein
MAAVETGVFSCARSKDIVTVEIRVKKGEA